MPREGNDRDLRRVLYGMMKKGCFRGERMKGGQDIFVLRVLMVLVLMVSRQAKAPGLFLTWWRRRGIRC